MTSSRTDVAPVIVDNPDRERYELLVDDEVAGYLTYRRSDDAIYIPSTVVLPAHRGQGLAAKLVQHVMDDARSAGLEVSTGCWYVRDWLAAHSA